MKSEIATNETILLIMTWIGLKMTECRKSSTIVIAKLSKKILHFRDIRDKVEKLYASADRLLVTEVRSYQSANNDNNSANVT